MNSISELIEQLRDNFRAMPFSSRAIAAMLLAVIVVGLGLLMQSGDQSDGTYLFGGGTISEEEMRKAEFAFGQAGLRDYEFIGNRIKVPTATSDLYLRAMTDGDALPVGESARTRDILKETNPFVSHDLLNKRLMVGKEQDIAARIMQFPDIKKASVFYDVQRQGFVADRQQSASVVVVPHGSEPISPYTKKRIADLVKGAYAGMKSEDVTVTDTNERLGATDPWLDENDLHYRTKRSYEREWESKIRSALVGYGPPQVVVDVELDPKLNSESTTLKYDPDGTTTEESSVNRTSSATTGTAAGVPGVATNAYGNSSASLNEPKENKESETIETISKVTGAEHTQTTTVGLVPVRASVLISLRASYYDELWKITWLNENPDKTEQDVPPLAAADRERLRTETKEEIQSAVATIIPRMRAGDDAFPLVTVLDYPDFEEATPLPVQTSGGVGTWLADSWQSIALVFSSHWSFGSASRSPQDADASEDRLQ